MNLHQLHQLIGIFLHFLTKNTEKPKSSVYSKAIWMKTTSSR